MPMAGVQSVAGLGNWRGWLARGAGALALLGAVACSTAAPTPKPAPAAPTTAAAPAPRSGAPAAVAAAPPTAAPAPVAVRLGSVGSVTDAGFFIGLDRGYFREQGLDVDLIPFDSAARMVAPLGAGQLEVGGGSHSTGLFNAIARNIDIR